VGFCESLQQSQLLGFASRFEQRSHVFSAEKTDELVPRKIFAGKNLFAGKSGN